MADGSTAGNATQRFCNGVLRRPETAGCQAGRGISAAASSLRCFAAIDRHGFGLLLVNPGMNVRSRLGKVGQVPVLERA